jgi:hypothetical protein
MPSNDFAPTASGQATAAEVTVHGYCDTPVELLLERFRRGDLESLRNLRGEYTLVHETPEGCTIITSPVGAMHHYYTVAGRPAGGFAHGRRIVDILRRAGLTWRWDWQALGDLCQLENLTGNATLHPEIRRVPPGSVLRFQRGELRIDTRQVGLAVVVLGGGRTRPTDPVDHAVGLTDLVAVGTPVAVGEPLARVHARSEATAAQAVAMVQAAYRLGSRAAVAGPVVADRITG